MEAVSELKKSTHKSEVVPVVLEKHPNADNLSIVNVWGYQAVCNSADWQGVTKAVYIVPDSVVDIRRPEFSFLAPQANREGKARIKAKKLRGVVSYGLLVPVVDDAVIGDDYSERLGVSRYEPPEPSRSQKDKLLIGGEEETAPDIYTGPEKYDIESFERYAFLYLTEGEPVSISEKLDGCNFRAVYHNSRYYVKTRNRWVKRQPDYSHITVEYLLKQKVEPEKAEEIVARLQTKEGVINSFWQQLEKEESLMKFLRDNPGVTVFGEIYGNTNRLKYGFKEGNRFAAFDIVKDGKFVNVQEFRSLLHNTQVPVVPELAYTDYKFEYVKELATGKTTVPGSTVIREGVVVRPVVERTANRFGRVIFKSVNPDFLAL